MPDESKYDVFISYARRDGSGHAARLEEALIANQFKTWRDKRDLDPDQDFSAELERAIEDSAHVVCCITPDVRRDNSFVRREIGFAQAVKKPIIPLIFADTIPPITIVNVTREDFTHTPWDRALFGLCARLRRGDDQTYRQISPPDDLYREYLHALYKQIVYFLDHTVFSLITLRSADTSEAVEEETSQRNVLPMVFFDMAGIENETPTEPATYASFHEAFERHEGRVLLLGEPGAGKTTTLFAFARDQITRRLEDPARPLPVIASLATWNAHERTPLAVWLASAIKVLPWDEIAGEIAAGRVLLLLDGLDELGREREDPQTNERYDPRARFIEALNLKPLPRPLPASGEGRPSPPGPLSHRVGEEGSAADKSPRHRMERGFRGEVVVTCRKTEYGEIGAKLALNGAVTLEPLNDEQMRDYLRDMPDLWAALEGDDDLREVARTPLLLSLFTFAYRDQGEAAAQLRDLRGSPGDLRDAIFRQYVERRYWHEKRKPYADVPFTLEEIYSVLGQVAMGNIGKSIVGISSHRLKGAVGLTLASMAIARSNTTKFVALCITKEDALRYRDFVQIVGSESVLPFLKLATQLHLITSRDTSRDERSYRFIHLLLRGHFAFGCAQLRLFDSCIEVRRVAAQILGELDDTRAMGPLLIALNDVDAEVRYIAANALGQLADAQAMEALIVTLDDVNAEVRWMAVWALEQLADVRSVKALIAALGDTDVTVNYQAVSALRKIGTPEALAAVEEWERSQGEENRNPCAA